MELAEKPLGYQSAQGDPGNKGVFRKRCSDMSVRGLPGDHKRRARP
jgi:hypothetical protein